MKSIGSDVIEKSSASDAISLLEILPNIDLIICRDHIGQENTGLNLANFFENEKHTIPLLIIGKNASKYKHLVSISPGQNWKSIITSAGQILGVNVVFDDNKMANEYVPVSLNYFLNITSTSLGCDVYIRVKKGDEYQYIKRLHSTDQFTREDIEKYKTGGLKEFFIPKEHFSQFVNFVTSQLTLKLEDKKVTTVDRLKLTSEAYELTLERIQSVGIDDYTVEIVEESIKSMQTSLSENNALAVFLQSLKDNQLSYGYSHAYLCSLLLHKVVVNFDWATAQVKEKLTFVSYFHDISLKDNLMKYRTELEVETSDLSNEDKNAVLFHAANSAAIVDKFPNIPTGISSIIKEHHGSKNGMGFPETLSIAISPIGMMFIVVEHFVDEFLKIEGPPKNQEMEKIFITLRAKYNKVTYEQTVVALESMILNKKK
jgi:HD-GYP domain-containing protein (c-di-GMP phosphodiesterase class II)